MYLSVGSRVSLQCSDNVSHASGAYSTVQRRCYLGTFYMLGPYGVNLK
jgi:hypothetical protein